MHFFTFFDSYYLLRGLALYRSLKRHCREFTLWVLCYDEASRDVLSRLNYPEIRLLAETDVESHEPRLRQVKLERSRVEYFFTCTAAIFDYLFTREPAIDLLTYVDADTYFYADPALMYEGLESMSVYIAPHRFPKGLEGHEEFGRFNAGYAAFRNDQRGRACLAWWRERCIEWCHDRLDGERYANQKYLDKFPQLFEGVAVLEHPGVDLAPWNLAAFPVSVRDGEVFAGGNPVVFYHFHGLKMIRPWLFDPSLGNYGAKLTRPIREAIYGPYIAAMREIDAEVCHLVGKSQVGSGHRYGSKGLLRAVLRRGKESVRLAVRIISGQCLLYRRSGALGEPLAASE